LVRKKGNICSCRPWRGCFIWTVHEYFFSVWVLPTVEASFRLAPYREERKVGHGR
jgi:hypothetical protein